MAIDYALEGAKWGPSAVNGSFGGTVTWSLLGSFAAQYRSEIQTAFHEWAQAANINFTQVADNTASNVTLEWGYIDGAGSVLGVTDYSFAGGIFTSARITFDSSEHWSAQASGLMEDGEYFKALALHEVGHAIGIDHYNATTAIMNAYLPLYTSSLLQSDIHAAQAVYGAVPAPQGVTTAGPNGTQVTHFADAQDKFAWTSADFFKNSSAQTTSADYHMDDGSRVIYIYDPNNQQTFHQEAFVYNQSGKTTSVDYQMDDGAHLVYTFDADAGSHVYVYDTNNSQSYSQVVFVRDASGKTTTIDYEMDDTTHVIYNFDNAGQSHVAHYDASWHLIA